MIRKLLLISALIIFTYLTGYAQWTVLHPYPAATSLTSVYFTDSNTGYITTYNDVFKTTDGGASWQNIKQQPGAYFTSSYFISSNTGFLASYTGKLYLTTDAGATWNSSTPITGLMNLGSLIFTDATTGYMKGKGTILKTTDAGLTWNKLNTGSGTTFNRLYFYDKNLGFAVGQKGVIYRTTNAGTSWDSLNTGLTYCDDKNLSAIRFTSTTTGYAGGIAGLIKTTDGGQTWTKNGNAQNISDLYFSSSTNGCAVTTGPSAYITTDGGTTWKNAVNTAGMSRVFFINATTGFGMGGYGTLSKTTDGGAHWQTDALQTENKCIWFTDANTGYLGCADDMTYNMDKIMKTTDAGKTWKVLDSASSAAGKYTFSRIRFTDANTGYAVGSTYSWGGNKALVLKTTDAGLNWKISNTNSVAGSFYYISFPTATTGYAAGMIPSGNGLLMKTTDAGTSWSQVTLTGPKQIKGIHFTDANTGFLIDGTAVLYKTSDGGTTWTTQNLVIEAFAVCFTNANNGYISGRYKNIQTGYVIRTTNGGNDWLTTTGQTYYKITSLAFADEMNGFGVGETGEITHTTDGGQTWAAQETQFHYMSERDFYDVSAAPGKAVYTVGRHGVILVNKEVATEVRKEHFAAKSFSLEQNYPNPFNPSTKITYQIPEGAMVTLKIYDILGREVKTLLSQNQDKGRYSVDFDGSSLSSGIYIYRLNVNNSSVTRKMMLAK